VGGDWIGIERPGDDVMPEAGTSPELWEKRVVEGGLPVARTVGFQVKFGVT